jgi:hypothetical protein
VEGLSQCIKGGVTGKKCPTMVLEAIADHRTRFWESWSDEWLECTWTLAFVRKCRTWRSSSSRFCCERQQIQVCILVGRWNLPTCLYYMQQYYKWTVPWCDGIDYRDTTDGLSYLCSIRFKPIGDFDMLYLQMIDTQF